MDKTDSWVSDEARDRPLRIAVIALPSFSNFTDFDALRHEPSVALHYCREPSQLASADVVVLPGSKQTVEDLLWMRRQELDSSLIAHSTRSLIVGICGGMQMLGTAIDDPLTMEHGDRADGLGLLPFATRMNAEKVTRQASGRLLQPTLFGQPVPATNFEGYEIHIGETIYEKGAQRFAILNEQDFDGCISPDTRIFGTYLHGIFDNDTFRHAFITAARHFHHLAPAARFENWKQKREQSFDRLADTVRESLDLPRIFDWVGLEYGSRMPIPAMEQSR
jgi:adenosylcobyric acid synthase